MSDPLTGSAEDGAREMAIALLKYANRAEVARALTANGYEVKRAAVNRWARGDEMPGIAARMILGLFGHTPDTTKDAPPEWARRLAVRLRAHSAKLQVSDEDLARAAIEEAAEWAVGEDGAARPQRSADGESTVPEP